MVTLRKLSVMALVVAGLVLESSLHAAAVDLESYKQDIMKENINVSKIDVQEDSVSLWNRQQAKFLGFVPMGMVVRAIVKSDGSMEIKYPWYKFLTAYDDSELKENLGVSVGNIFKSKGDEGFSDNTKARLVGVMSAMMNKYGGKNGQDRIFLPPTATTTEAN